MKNRIPRSAAWLLLTLSLLSSPIAAQNRRSNTTKKTPPRPVAKETLPTFDTLLAANSYTVYVEVRGVGQLIRSTGVGDLLDPVTKFASPPKEFRTLIKWLNAHAEELATSRLLFATAPTRAKLPQVICAIEFATEEEAAKFEPELNAVLPKLFPTPTPSPSPGASPQASPQTAVQSTPQKPKPPYLLKHSGTLVLLSDSQLNLKDLRPPDSKLLRDDPNFRLARDRFNSEPVFFYLDIMTGGRRRSEPPTVEQKTELELHAKESRAAPTEPTDPASLPQDETVPEAIPTETPAASPQPEQTTNEPDKIDQERRAAIESAMMGLSRAFFGGPPRWPDAIGIGLVFEAESYVVRALFVNSEENKNVLVPFVPQLMAGPPLTPAAPAILPADTELFISASVDFAEVHDNMVKSAKGMQAENRQDSPQQAAQVDPPESPFAAYERLLGIDFKKDLIPLLGNEIALSVPINTFLGTPPPAPQKGPSSETEGQPKATPEPPAVVFALSLRDREGVRVLLPKLIESIGMKGASLVAQSERRDDTELVSFAGLFSYAFVGDFLVSSTDPKAVRQVVDKYLKRQTLASDSSFHTFTRWQPRQVQGQIYVSTALAESYEAYAAQMNAITNEQLRDFITSLTPASEPITYALVNEGPGPLHELHLPRKLVLLMIAGMSAGAEQSSVAANESVASMALQMIAHAEESFKSKQSDGRYGSLQELIDAGLLPQDVVDRYGYKIEMFLSGNGFEARATPNEYGKTGKRSFFIDQTGVLRAGDHGGGPATIVDPAVQ